jgi:UDP-N-acetylmuramate-alanine ligase
MRIHFIAIGGSAMHNLAIALANKNHTITGSDDEIFEPARSRLDKYGLLPKEIGFKKENITPDIEAIILGMHAKSDNPELLEAQRLDIKIYSYPEFLYEMSKDKKRIVIGGSHGKTTITAMILHAMKTSCIETDYMVGALLEGFDVMVKITDSAKYMVLEGDEYLTSTIDRRPKFHLYQPNIALISGIAWDHINVFPTFENYVLQFKIFTNKISPKGLLIYYKGDKNVSRLASAAREDIKRIPYSILPHIINNGITTVLWEGKQYEMEVFGQHNLANMYGAMLVCAAIGINNHDFLKAMTTFKGASKRLECVKKNNHIAVYKDFAHSPSKITATISALKEQFPLRRLVAVLELHTFSSLSKEFLVQYSGTMDKADRAIVYFSKEAIELKRLPMISTQDVKEGFARADLQVYTQTEDVRKAIMEEKWQDCNLLMSSSGDFCGINVEDLAKEIIAD